MKEITEKWKKERGNTRGFNSNRKEMKAQEKRSRKEVSRKKKKEGNWKKLWKRMRNEIRKR